MAAIGLLRDLLRLRRLVLVGAILALAAALLMTFRVSFDPAPSLSSRQYDVGIASAAILIDSQSSQAVDLGGGGEVLVDVGSLAVRARLLANLLVTRPLRDEIAAEAGVRPDQLITELSSTTEPGAPPPEASEVTLRPDDPRANILRLQTSDTVPIVTVNAQAPDKATAARLAAATVSQLERYLESVAAANRVPDVRQLVMRRLGEPTAVTARRGPARSNGVMIFIVLFGLWCGGVLAVSAVSRAWWQQAAAYDSAGDGRMGEDLWAPDLPPAPNGEVEAAGWARPGDVGEGANDDPWLPPAPESTSRVA
jgi:hypothetical protein